MPIGDIRTLGDGRALMFYQRLPPAIVRLPTWFRSSDARSITGDIDEARQQRATADTGQR
jgi:hypothetical protein